MSCPYNFTKYRRECEECKKRNSCDIYLRQKPFSKRTFDMEEESEEEEDMERLSLGEFLL